MADKAQEIDINDPMLQQEMVEANPDADFFEPPPPPPDDREYQVKVTLGDRGIVVRKQQKKEDPPNKPSGHLYLNVHLEERIIDPDMPWDNLPLYDNATSIVMGGKDGAGTSALHTILRALRNPAAAKMTLSALKDHVLNVLASEPTAVITGKWEAQIEDGVRPNGSANYRTVKKGMKNFPLIDPANPAGGHYNYVEDPKTGETCRAQFRIERYRLE
jgi:hypothetical protein